MFLYGRALIITLPLAIFVAQLSTSLTAGDTAAQASQSAPRAKSTPQALPTPAVTVNNTGAIAFFSARDGVNHIYLMNADGTDVTQLTSGPFPESSLSWSRDGTKLAFWRQQDGEAIYTMNADGSNEQRLSPSPGYDIFPSWSPDGTQLVYTRIVSPPANAQQLPITQIMIMNADGTNVRSILNNNMFNTEPRWSPNGSKILFMSAIGGNGVQIYTMNTDGTNLTALTNVGTNGDPVWSPDGSKIAFGSNREGGGKLDIFTMNADGSGVQQLTHFLPPDEAGDTGWSSDGSQIAFEWDIGSDDQSNPNAYAEVWVMNADGTNPASTGQQCSGVGCSPRWQPGAP